MRYLILGLLRRGERIHGYALWKMYERRFGQPIQNGKFYRILKSLAEAGFIRPTAHAASDPRRVPYEITPAGGAAFDRWVVTLDADGGAGEDEISSRALFVFELGREVTSTLFAGLEDVLSARWKRLEYLRERTLSRPGISDRERCAQALLLARDLEHASADLAWLRDTRAAYEKLAVAAEQRPAPVVAAPRSSRLGRVHR